jgi:hypothetical protein
VTLALAGVSLIACISAFYRLRTVNGTLFGGLLYDPGMRFSDLRDIINAAASGIPYGAETATGTTTGPTYPPAAFLLGDAFARIPPTIPRVVLIALTAAAVGAVLSEVMLRNDTRRRKALAFATGAASTLLGATLLNSYTLVLALACVFVLAVLLLGRHSWTLTSCVALPIMAGLSFPIVFAIDRLNIDLVVFQLVTLTVILIDRNRGKLAATAFGVAIAIKAYPIYFAIADPRQHGRWTRAAIALGTAVVLTAVALANMDYAPQDLAMAFQRSSVYFEQHYIIASEGMQYGASAFTAISIIYFKQGHTDVMAFNTHLYALWKPAAAAATILLAALAVTLRLPPWCRLMIVVSALAVLSPTTGAYRLTLLLIPVAMWIASSSGKDSVDRSRRVMNILLGVCLGVSISPLTLFSISWFEPTLNLTSQSLLGPIAIISVLMLALIRGIQERHRPMY